MQELTTIPSALRRALAVGRVRASLIAAAAVTLAAVLGYLYFKTQGADFKRQSAVLALLRELKEIDARWDVDIPRIRSEFAPPQVRSPDHGAALARIRQELAVAAQEVDSPVLTAGIADLRNAFARKAEMIDKFRKASAATRQALSRVLSADTEIAGLVRGSWHEFQDRERLVAAESVVVQVLAEAQKYYFAPSGGRRKGIEALVADLREAAGRLPPALRDGILRLDGNVQQLLGAKPIEHELFVKLSFLTAGPRVDSLTHAYSRELEDTLAERERFRVYLIVYSAALLILIGYLASRLVASYRLLNAANLALTSANEELEQRVAERTDALSQALKQLKESEAQLIQTEKMSSLGQMVAGVAHEMNTPLAYVKNSVGSVREKLPELARLVAECEKLLALLRASERDPAELSRQFALTQKLVAQFEDHRVLDELQELMRDGLYGIDQISSMVVNLKNFSRLGRGEVASFDLNEGLESTLLLARHELKKHKIVKRFGNIPPVTCSPSQINQVLLNLINNAAQAIERAHGVITITTRQADAGHVAVEVEDDGKGIPPEILPKIFDPFFTTKDVGEGTGLGLSIAYKIVEQHGGRISVDSTVGAGTKFTMVLPLTPPKTRELISA